MDMQRFYPKKITVKEMKLLPEKLEETIKGSGGKAVLVASVYGKLTGSKPETSDIGAYSRFSGKFEAINHLDNTCFRSQVLIVPSVAEPILEEHLGCKAEEFGLQLFLAPNTSGKPGSKYVWQASPLTQPSADDPITAIGKRLGAVPKPAIEDKAAKAKGK